MDYKIALIGLGNVGKSFLQILKEQKERLNQKFNLECKIVAVFEFDGMLINEKGINLEEVLTNKHNYRALPYWKKNVKANDIIPNLNVNLCIEATPTNPNSGEPALSHIITALKNGIDVISSNKGPFYLEYENIKKIAKENSCYIRYEATVASCVPCLSIKENLIGTEIIRIKAILNGTCNYILSRMTAERSSFEIALKEAQELGIAEADPTLDIEGWDAAGKLVILANELLGWSKNVKDVDVKGITNITPQAIELAKSDGYVIKHLALVENENLIVEPRLVDMDDPLNISGSLNIIELRTKYAGPILLMGRGAGGFEAASAILNDLLAIAKERGFAKY